MQAPDISFSAPMRWALTWRVRGLTGAGVIATGPALVVATLWALGRQDAGLDANWVRGILLADLVYILIVASLIAQAIARVMIARRRRSTGADLHLRLTGLFVGMALVPTVLVAGFATITINVGLEGWFSDRVRSALGNSVAAAEAYAQEHRAGLVEDARALGNYLDGARRRSGFPLSDGDLRRELAQGQGLVQRGLAEAFVIDGTGDIRARGERSYFFDFDAPDVGHVEQARGGEVVVIEDQALNEFRALVPLREFPNRFLYVTREVDGGLLDLLDETTATAQLYQQLESDRGRFLFQFGLLYLAFALMLILAATWAGLAFAERLSRPIGRLAAAAQRVGQGDLDIRVPEERGGDEVSMLGRLFNQMTRQLKAQRDALVETNRNTERRRRLFDSVLSSVTSGVVGLDAAGAVDFVNRSGLSLLRLQSAPLGRRLADVVPEWAALLERARSGQSGVVQDEIRLVRGGALETLLVRVAARLGADGTPEGYVVAFDDVTELVSAQRMAAWADVARRIAHEIKNPLTPIQLSAERVKRRFGRELESASAEKLGELTDVIVRQTNDLRRIVDEFSRFARMPEPERRRSDLAALLRETVTLQSAAFDPIVLEDDLPEGAVIAEFDPTQIGQAFTNLIKNAGEAVETRMERDGPDAPARVSVSMAIDGAEAVIRVADTGIGLPQDRARLFEPYVTTRDKGTGLGLPIVKKIIEEHGGALTLSDADPDETGHRGAEASIRLPIMEQ